MKSASLLMVALIAILASSVQGSSLKGRYWIVAKPTNLMSGKDVIKELTEGTKLQELQEREDAGSKLWILVTYREEGGKDVLGWVDRNDLELVPSRRPWASVEYSGPPDFRDVHWGMTVSEVKASEKFNLVKDIEEDLGSTILLYSGVLWERAVSVEYRFTEDRLFTTSVAILGEHKTRADWNKEYEAIRAKLEKQYEIGQGAQAKTRKSSWKTERSMINLYRPGEWFTQGESYVPEKMPERSKTLIVVLWDAWYFSQNSIFD